MSASEKLPKRRRNPRRIPHSEVLEIGYFATEDLGSNELATIAHRAKLDFTLDPRVRDLTHWIGLWVKRWPHVTASFWRSMHHRESWDIARQDVWEQYKGKALEVFIDFEIKRSMKEMAAQEKLLDIMYEKLKGEGDDAVKPKTFEGMVSALVKLARLNSDQRTNLLDKFATPSKSMIGSGALGKADGSLPRLVGSTKSSEENKEMAKNMARFLLTGKKEKEDDRGTIEEDDRGSESE